MRFDINSAEPHAGRNPHVGSAGAACNANLEYNTYGSSYSTDKRQWMCKIIRKMKN